MAPPLPYNLTATFGNTTGIVRLTQSVNTVIMGGYFGVLLLASIFILSYMGFIRESDTKTAFVSSSFIVFVFSLMLRALTLVNDWTVYICIGILAISVALAWKK